MTPQELYQARLDFAAVSWHYDWHIEKLESLAPQNLSDKVKYYKHLAMCASASARWHRENAEAYLHAGPETLEAWCWRREMAGWLYSSTEAAKHYARTRRLMNLGE